LVKKATAVLEFWFGSPGSPEFGKSRNVWFKKDEAFDAEIINRFGAIHACADAGRYDAWQATPKGSLALIILLDQFPRNMYRGQPASFASDAHARRIARNALAHGFDRGVLPVQRTFFYLPFEHSEDIADQRLSLKLFNQLGANQDYARRHYDIVARFGRFPHRNAILGRESTPEEAEFLKQPGSGF
jgi:uncharacterized protein (DUF924 family)